MIRVDVREQPLNVAALQAEVGRAGAGAVLSFVGTVRNDKGGRRVLHIDYDAYVPMARRILQSIAADVARRWPTCAVVIEHRVGHVEVGQASVVIALSTPHRADGFAALRHAIEALKRDAPIWKREYFEDGSVWVQEGS